MNERILYLLILCMEAHKKGHHIDFRCGYYVVQILHMVADEQGDYEIVRNLEFKTSDVQRVEEAEAYLKGLVEA